MGLEKAIAMVKNTVNHTVTMIAKLLTRSAATTADVYGVSKTACIAIINGNRRQNRS